jgi:LemA protein
MVVWIIVLAVVMLIALFFLLGYNRLVRLRNQIEAAWSQIDVQLKRRYDLIPNLVETVKGYAAHERETFEAVTRARQQAIDASGIEDQAQAENFLTQTLRQLFAVAEAYPDLKANQNFLALQEELTGTEGRIAFARQFYNDRILVYDNALEQFPSSVIAGMFNFEEKPYFEAEEQSREAVRVDFGQGGGSGAPPAQTGPPAQAPPSSSGQPPPAVP